MAEVRTAYSTCRMCAGQCGLVLEIENQQIIRIRGDKQHPMTGGYACIKGLNSHHAHHGPERLLRPLKRQLDGTFIEIPLRQALDEIAERAQELRLRHGGETLAAFKGTQAYLHAPAEPLMKSFLSTVGSPHYFTTMTIDQSAKYVAAERLGVWMGNAHAMEDADVLAIFGGNPLLSITAAGVTSVNVASRFRALRQRGGKLVVVDPRRTETAAMADVHLAIRPGEDATLAAAMIRLILAEGWHDANFTRDYVADLEELREAVEPYTLAMAADRCDVPAEDIAEATRIFAKAKRGIATTGTGANMNVRSNLAEHLVQCLNVLCGRFYRAGEAAPNGGVLWRRPLVAQVSPPTRGWEGGHQSRVRGYGTLMGEAMCATLPEEILTPGEGSIRALFVLAGNPAASFPDQRKAVEAIEALDLLVVVDPFMTETARLSDYVLPPYLMFERPDFMFAPGYESFLPEPFQQYVGVVLDPPAGSDLIEDWALFFELAKAMGLTLDLMGKPLDMGSRPTSEALLEKILDGGTANVSLEELKRHPRGMLLDLPLNIVAPGIVDEHARFHLAPADVFSELAELATGATEPGADRYPYRLIARRSREQLNTLGRTFPACRARVPYNPAFMHPDELARLGLVEGDRIEIWNDHARIPARISPDPTLRGGVVSMFHNFGRLPDDKESYDEVGSNTSLLIELNEHAQSINAMPRMTGIPVDIKCVPA